MKVKNKPMINKSEDYQFQLIKLQEEYDKLQEKYTQLKIDYENILEENQKFKNGEVYIDLQRKSLDDKIKKRIKGNNNNLNEDEINDESLKKLNEEFKKMENNYRELIKNKDEEYNNNLKIIEKDISKKEQEYENMKIELNKLENKNKELENVNYDLKKLIKIFKILF